MNSDLSFKKHLKYHCKNIIVLTPEQELEYQNALLYIGARPQIVLIPGSKLVKNPNFLRNQNIILERVFNDMPYSFISKKFNLSNTTCIKVVSKAFQELSIYHVTKNKKEKTEIVVELPELEKVKKELRKAKRQLSDVKFRNKTLESFYSGKVFRTINGTEKRHTFKFYSEKTNELCYGIIQAKSFDEYQGVPKWTDYNEFFKYNTVKYLEIVSE